MTIKLQRKFIAPNPAEKNLKQRSITFKVVLKG